ncbi:MAG: MBG domain-containing protein [Opitutaceae bacterium]
MAAPERADAARAANVSSVWISAAAQFAYAQGWNEGQPPTMAAFRDWVSRYQNSSPDVRARLAAEGVALAHARRAEMVALIVDDPRRALELTVPAVVRAALPAGVRAELETRVSGVGDYAILPVEPSVAGSADPDPDVHGGHEPWVFLDDDRYIAHVYGRRSSQKTQENASLHGIALDGHLALHESPLRVLEPGEIAAAPLATRDPVSGVSIAPAGEPDSLLVEAHGRSWVISPVENVLIFADELNAAEALPGPNVPAPFYASVPGTPSIAAATAKPWTTGIKKVLVLRVDFSDLPGAPVAEKTGKEFTPAEWRALFANEIGPFFEAASFGKATIEVEVAGNVYRMPEDAEWYATHNSFRDLRNHAEDKYDEEIAPGGQKDYDAVVVAFSHIGPGRPEIEWSSESEFDWAGLAFVEGTGIWLNGYFDFRTVAHELGHVYGLHHANSWSVPEGNSPVSPHGMMLEYGDVFDLMGSGWDASHHFNQLYKNKLGWLPDEQVIDVATSGTYRLFRFDKSNLVKEEPLALRIDRGGDASALWLGYRKPAPYSVALSDGVYALWDADDLYEGSRLLDLSPSDSEHNVALGVGMAFEDQAAGVSIRTVATGGSGPGAFVDVSIEFGAEEAGVSITSQPQSATVNEGAPAEFITLAEGPGEVAYRWQRRSPGSPVWNDVVDGDRYSGARSQALKIENVSETMSGEWFRCIVNSELISTEVTLLVEGKLIGIATPPADVSVKVREAADFEVKPFGVEPFEYQWFKNDQPLSGQTGSSFRLLNVTGNQAGNYSVEVENQHGSVRSAVATLSVERLAQTITFPALRDRTFGDAAFTLGASADSSLPVSYSVTGPATLNNATLAITGAGTVSVTASQAGNASYSKAEDVTRAFNVAKATPVVTWPAPASITYGSPLSATQLSATASMLGIFNYTPAAGAVLDVGADQVLRAVFTPADAVNYQSIEATTTLTVSRAPQTINFPPIADQTPSAPPILLGASSSSGLPLSFTVSGPATVSAGVLTINGTGLVSVTAKQGGNTRYLAAADVTRSFAVTEAQASIVFDGLSATYDGQAKPVIVTTVPAGLGVTVLYDGAATVPMAAGTYAVTATIVDDNYTGAATASLVIAKAPQTIDFPAPGVQQIDGPPLELAAVASSGLPVSFALVSGPAVLSGTTLTFNGAGAVAIRATQAGDSNFEAAPAVERAFDVAEATAVVTISDLKFVYDGAPKAVSVSTVPGNLPVDVTYDGSPTAPSAKGAYTVVATVTDPNYAGSATATLSIHAGSQLVNLSSRALVGAGNDIMIPGFVVGGAGTKNLLIRGIGPALTEHGVEGVLAQPTLRLIRQDTSAEIASNTGWSTAPNAAEIAQRTVEVGAFALPANSADCAILIGLAPGAYTVQLAGVNNTSGIGLVDLYDLDETGSSARLVNLSSRAWVGTASNVLIPGYVIDGDVPRTLLIRAVGPTLASAPFNLAGELPDPALTVYRRVGEASQPVESNDNWHTNANAAEIQTVAATIGAFPLNANSQDAAVLLTLDPGVYTVNVSGAGNTTGVTLVEVYEIPSEP